MKKYFSMLVILISLISISNVFADPANKVWTPGTVTWSFEVVTPIEGGVSGEDALTFNLLKNQTLQGNSDAPLGEFYYIFGGTPNKGIIPTWTTTGFNSSIATVDYIYENQAAFNAEGVAEFSFKIIKIIGINAGSFTITNTLSVAYAI